MKYYHCASSLLQIMFMAQNAP